MRFPVIQDPFTNYAHWGCLNLLQMKQLPLPWTICTRIVLENYNNNYQQFNRHDFLIKFNLIIDFVEVVGSSPIKGPCCFLEQETLPLLLNSGWLQERNRTWFHNRTKINWRPYGRLTWMSNNKAISQIINQSWSFCQMDIGYMH